MFSIDGVQWTVPCDITRVSEMKSSEISGMLLDKSYFNDVIGQYLRYDVTIAVPTNMLAAYNQIYEKLTAPVDAHTFILPYNESTVTITGRVESISDVYVRMPGGGTFWRGTSFTVAAMHPTKTMTLSEVITRGRTALPPTSPTPEEGAFYVWHNGAWVQENPYDDADSISY